MQVRRARLASLIVSLASRQIRVAIEKMNAGSLLPRPSRANISFVNGASDALYEDTITSVATSSASDSHVLRPLNDNNENERRMVRIDAP